MTEEWMNECDWWMVNGLLVGKQRFPRQQADINTAESVAATQEIHEESDAVCHHDEGLCFSCARLVFVAAMTALSVVILWLCVLWYCDYVHWVLWYCDYVCCDTVIIRVLWYCDYVCVVILWLCVFVPLFLHVEVRMYGIVMFARSNREITVTSVLIKQTLCQRERFTVGIRRTSVLMTGLTAMQAKSFL